MELAVSGSYFKRRSKGGVSTRATLRTPFSLRIMVLFSGTVRKKLETLLTGKAGLQASQVSEGSAVIEPIKTGRTKGHLLEVSF